MRSLATLLIVMLAAGAVSAAADDDDKNRPRGSVDVIKPVHDAFAIAGGDDKNKAANVFVFDGDDKKKAGKVVASMGSWLTDEGKSESLAIVYRDGKIEVTRNGKPVPDAHIRRNGPNVTILDENGKPAASFQIFEDGRIVMGGDAGAGLGADPFGPGAGGRWTPFAPPGGAAAFDFDPEQRVIIGINMGEVDGALAAHLGLDPGSCVMITGVLPGHPAEKAGLKQHDIITHINGATPATGDRLRKLLTGKEPGYRVNLRVLRKGQPIEVTVGTQYYKSANPLQPGGNQRFGGGIQPGQNVWQGLRWDPSGVWVAPDVPFGSPDAEGRFQWWTPAPAPGDRLGELEKRLERLEALLHELLEKKKADNL